MNQQFKKHVTAWKKIRRFISEDYYLIEPQSRTLENWSGWQFHGPKTGQGFVRAFRVHSPEATRKLVLHAFDAKSNYQFTDLYTGKTFEAAGAKLLTEGREFDLPPMSSRVLTYRKV